MKESLDHSSQKIDELQNQIIRLEGDKLGSIGTI